MTATKNNYSELHQRINVGLDTSVRESLEHFKTLTEQCRQEDLDELHLCLDSGLESVNMYDEFSDQWLKLYQKNKLN